MKYLIIYIFLVASLPIVSKAQYTPPEERNDTSEKERSGNSEESNNSNYPKEDDQITSNIFIGMSTGINNMSGLFGPHLDIVLAEKVMIEGSFGLSTWGLKSNINLQYHPHNFKKMYYKVGFSNNSGIEDYSAEFETQNSSQPKEVEMILHRVSNLNFQVGYAWNIGSNNRFYLEGGYSLRLTSEDDLYTVRSNDNLSDSSEAVMSLLAPGGYIIALGVAFGL